jgi:hypothetical protein
MTGDREERTRAFGMPQGTDRHARQGEEPQRVLGVPLDWYGPVNRELYRAFTHPVRTFKRWRLRRRLGPYAPPEEEPQPRR